MPDSRIEADPERQFFEGDFLATIFNMLKNVLDNEYDTNLLLTSVLSRLCQLPHPHLHEYLLNPTIPLQQGARNLYGVVKEALGLAVDRAENMTNFQHKMKLCRRRLLGDAGGDGDDKVEDVEETLLLEAILVLEEFCKELAAVSFVKYHCNS